MAITIERLIRQIQQHQPVLNQSQLNLSQQAFVVTGVGSLANATHQQLSFLAKSQHSKIYRKALADSQAGVILVSSDNLQQVPSKSIALVVENPYLAYASCSQLFEKFSQSGQPDNNDARHISHQAGDLADNQQASCYIHQTAIIADSAVIEAGVSIGAYCVIGERSVIGAGTQLSSHVSIGEDVTIGQQCVIAPQVVIAHHCQLGDGVRVHAHASIGSEGFGFAPTADPAHLGWERIAQLGRVIIGHQVRIGSQTCIDRGAIDDTIIGDNVIIDNLVQIAHNVHIGAGTAIAAKTGIAGSVRIGKRCIIGGAVGISGHLIITDDVTLTAKTLVTKSIHQSGSYSSGTVAMPTAKWRRAVVRFRQVD